MSTARHGAAAAVLAALTLAACGSGGNRDDESDSGTQFTNSARRALPAGLAESVEVETAAFLEREGTALRRSLHRFLGPELTTEVERGSAICRPGSETPSIADPRRHPFACIVRAGADGEGLQVEIVLGFVGTEFKGPCWRAANERVAVTTSLPELLSREEAERSVNQIAGCA